MPISIFPNPIQVVSGLVTTQGADGVLPVRVDGSGVTQPVAIVADPMQPVPVSGSVVADITAVGGVPMPAGQGVPVSVQGTVPVSLPLSVSVSIPDGAEVTLGSQADAPAYTVATSSLMAQIKALNDAIQTLTRIASQQLQLLAGVLQATNSVAGQLGAAPAATDLSASIPLN